MCDREEGKSARAPRATPLNERPVSDMNGGEDRIRAFIKASQTAATFSPLSANTELPAYGRNWKGRRSKNQASISGCMSADFTLVFSSWGDTGVYDSNVHVRDLTRKCCTTASSLCSASTELHSMCTWVSSWTCYGGDRGHAHSLELTVTKKEMMLHVLEVPILLPWRHSEPF